MDLRPSFFGPQDDKVGVGFRFKLGVWDLGFDFDEVVNNGGGFEYRYYSCSTGCSRHTNRVHGNPGPGS